MTNCHILLRAIVWMGSRILCLSEVSARSMRQMLGHVVGRFLGVFILITLLGSGLFGSCWCTLLEHSDCDGQTASHVQKGAVADTDCCDCELCDCCGLGISAVAVETVSEQIPLHPVAVTPALNQLRLQRLADEIFIPPKITA
jgi:hypothetical protein